MTNSSSLDKIIMHPFFKGWSYKTFLLASLSFISFTTVAIDLDTETAKEKNEIESVICILNVAESSCEVALPAVKEFTITVKIIPTDDLHLIQNVYLTALSDRAPPSLFIS